MCSICRERSGSVVKCLTRDWRAMGSSLTGLTVLSPWARHVNPGLVLVQPRKTRSDITENCWLGRKESNQTPICDYLKHCCFGSLYSTILSPGQEVIKLFSCSTQLSIKSIMLKNVKMPTIVGILTFIRMMNTTFENLKARKVFNIQHFRF